MEPRFGHDFSRVRVHSDQIAEQSAREINALAYTIGHNIVFGAGQFAPNTHEGQQLVAHELTHVVQQSGLPFDQSTVLHLDVPVANSENDSASNAIHMLTDDNFVATRGKPGGGIQRLQRQAVTGINHTEPTEFPAIDSMSGTLTLDEFASDSAELTAKHRKAVSDYKMYITQLLKQYPDSYITAAGHTDATDTEEHSRVLSQQRAEAVMTALGEGESAIPTSIMHAYGMGKTQLRVGTKQREPRNHRVEVFFVARSFSFRQPPAFTATAELQRGSGYVMPPRSPPIYGDQPPSKPDFMQIPPLPEKGTESRSLLDLISESPVEVTIKATLESEESKEKDEKKQEESRNISVEGVVSKLPKYELGNTQVAPIVFFGKLNIEVAGGAKSETLDKLGEANKPQAYGEFKPSIPIVSIEKEMIPVPLRPTIGFDLSAVGSIELTKKGFSFEGGGEANLELKAPLSNTPLFFFGKGTGAYICSPEQGEESKCLLKWGLGAGVGVTFGEKPKK